MLVLLLSVALQAQGKTREDCEKIYSPQIGQDGKDVIWVPTDDALVERMLEMAKVTKDDLVYDLGAGDGKIAIAAAKKFGARAVGVEYNPDMVKLAQCMAEVEGVADRAKIIQGDIFETDFSDATVVTLYLLPSLNLRLRPTLLDMKPGTRVVSHSFTMDDWTPDQESEMEGGNAYLWIVPAKVAGTWTFREQDGNGQFVAKLDQTFQELKVTAGERGRKLTEGRLNGSDIEFIVDDGRERAEVKGRVNGDRIEAKVTRNGKTTNYIGRRA
ncbi:MAG TPA: class I SAM-dependent methyltransferase [Steroidobacteraceae bacterium]